MQTTLIILSIIGAFCLGLFCGYGISIKTIKEVREMADMYFKMAFRLCLQKNKLPDIKVYPGGPGVPVTGFDESDMPGMPKPTDQALKPGNLSSGIGSIGNPTFTKPL